MVCGEGNGNPLQYPCLENHPDRGPWLLQSMGFQRIRYNLATKQQHVIRLVFHHWGNVLTISYPLSKKKDNLQRNVRRLYLAALIMKYSRGKHRKEKDFGSWSPGRHEDSEPAHPKINLGMAEGARKM